MFIQVWLNPLLLTFFPNLYDLSFCFFVTFPLFLAGGYSFIWGFYLWCCNNRTVCSYTGQKCAFIVDRWMVWWIEIQTWSLDHTHTHTCTQWVSCYAGSSWHILVSASIIWSASRLLGDTCRILITASLMDLGLWTFIEMNSWGFSASRRNNLHCLIENFGVQPGARFKHNTCSLRLSPQRGSLQRFVQSASGSHPPKVEATGYQLWIDHISLRNGCKGGFKPDPSLLFGFVLVKKTTVV